MPELHSIDGPSSPSHSGPFEPLQNEFRRMEIMLGFLFEDPEEAIQEFSEEILALPPEERYTESAEHFKGFLQDEVGDIDTVRAVIPANQMSGERIVSLTIEIWEQLIEETLEMVFAARDAESAIIVSAGYSAIRHGFVTLQNQPELSEERKKQVLSSMLAFSARLIEVHQRNAEEGVFEQLVEDVGYTLFYIDDAISEEPDFPNPDEASFEEVRRVAREFGAVIAYRRMNISVGRAAELAGVSRYEFEDLLERFDIEPRYGPFSVDELHDDGVGLIDD